MYVFATLLASLVSLVIVFYKYWFGYWKRLGFPYVEPSIPFGNAKKLFTQQFSFAEQFAYFYNHFKAQGHKHGGVFVFARPFWVPVDKDIIKAILIRDFNHFVGRGFFINEELDPLSGHLFALEGPKWKDLRYKLTATFTSGKMKMMFDTVADTAKELRNILDQTASSNQPIDIKEYLSRFTIDVISSCAFGLETNSLKNPDAKFRHYGRRVFENTAWENIRNLVQFIFPMTILRFFKFKLNKPDVEKFMLKTIKDTVEYRENQNIHRKDFLHMLIQLKNRGKLSDDNNLLGDGSEKGVLTLGELSAQVFVFFLAGYETSSTAMTFALYELARNPDVQEKVRDEIRTVIKNHNNKLTYDALMEMTYLEKVLQESMRLYPSLPFLNRKCSIPYKVPGTNLIIEEGTMVVIPLLGVQHDSEYWDEPEKFQPERFNEDLKKTRPTTAWLPFGDGPRNCIGSRFGMMQSKIGLITVLKNYEISINSGTQEPLEIDRSSIVYCVKGNILLDLKKIN